MAVFFLKYTRKMMDKLRLRQPRQSFGVVRLKELHKLMFVNPLRAFAWREANVASLRTTTSAVGHASVYLNNCLILASALQSMDRCNETAKSTCTGQNNAVVKKQTFKCTREAAQEKVN